MSGLRFSIRELLLVTLVVALILGWGVQTYLRTWPTASERALMQEKLESLREIVTEHNIGIGESSSPDHKAFRDAEIAALAAEIELEESNSQRIRLHQRIVEATQRYEKIAAQRYEVGSGTHTELLSAKADRLTAEIALEKAKAGR